MLKNRCDTTCNIKVLFFNTVSIYSQFNSASFLCYGYKRQHTYIGRHLHLLVNRMLQRNLNIDVNNSALAEINYKRLPIKCQKFLFQG